MPTVPRPWTLCRGFRMPVSKGCPTLHRHRSGRPTPSARRNLAVEGQHVVHAEVEFGDGGMVVESGVCSMPVVVVEEGGEISGTDGGVLIGASVSPFPQRGL